MVVYKDNVRISIPSDNDKIEAAKNIKFSLDEIETMLTAWKTEERLFLPERIICNLFDNKEKPFSDKVDDEFLKVSIVNQFYGTNLYLDDIYELAKYISENSEKLNNLFFLEDTRIISDITCSIKKSRGKYCYSFATKYCSFAASGLLSDKYPIYDSYMSILYKTRTDKWNPNKQEGFYNYFFDAWEGNMEHDNRRYEIYRSATYMMQYEIAKVKKLTIKQMDQYLWKAMKMYLDEK